ncbi:MAG: glycosyltransferase family 4 protein [Alphaproteobacteria bacterium]|nr:glycosyltransferase family 4 protein [Alphaproteobacteria bacterium]
MVANPKAVQTKIKKEAPAKKAGGKAAPPVGANAEVNKSLNARILILSPDLNNAMLGRQAVDLAIRVRAEGGHPFIASPGGLLKLELQRQKIPHKMLPDMRASALGHMVAVFQLVRWAREQHIHFIHALDFSLSRFAYEVMLKTGMHTAISLNQPIISVLAGRNAEILRSFARIIVPSSYAREQLLQQLGLPESVVRTIIPGINLGVVHYDRISPQKIMTLEKNWQLPDDHPIVVVPDCPLDPVIFDTMATAFKELKERNITTILFVPEEERAFIIKRVAAFGLLTHVIVTSDVQDRIPALWLAHTVLVTGFQGQESLRALIEAQAMGRPIVAFDRNGLGEIMLRDNATVLLPADQVNRLTAALARSLKLSTEQRQSFAFRARSFVENNFDRKQMIEDVIDTYRELREIQN